METNLMFIGEIKTPHKDLKDCPPNISKSGVICELKIYDKYKDGLFGLKAGDRILVLYWLDKANRIVEITKPFKGYGDELCGTFNLRSPHRPNPIGVATLEITNIQGNTIIVRGLDCLNNTKLLDIKPCIE